MEKRFGIGFDGENDYLSIPDDDDFAFSGGPFTLSMNIDLARLKGDHTIIEVKDEDTHLIRFEVVRHG